MRTYLTDLISTEIILTILIMLIVGIILISIFSQKIEHFKRKYRGKFFTYLILMLLTFAVIPFLGNNRSISEVLIEFIFYQCGALLMGIVHVFVYERYFEKFENEDLWLEFLFNLAVLTFIMVPFTLLYTYLNGTNFLYFMLTSFIAFVLPTCVYATYQEAVSIPAKVLKRWYAPVGQQSEEPKESEMVDLIVVDFIFNKTVDDPIKRSFRAKAPVHMNFGRLFYHFISDYNSRHDEEHIQFSDDNGAAYGWVFYLKPEWYGFARYIDPKLPIYANGIKENSVIICHREVYEQPTDEIGNEELEKKERREEQKGKKEEEKTNKENKISENQKETVEEEFANN